MYLSQPPARTTVPVDIVTSGLCLSFLHVTLTSISITVSVPVGDDHRAVLMRGGVRLHRLAGCSSLLIDMTMYSCRYYLGGFPLSLTFLSLLLFPLLHLTLFPFWLIRLVSSSTS